MTIADLLAIPEAPLKPVLDAAVFVQPRDGDPATEKQRQRTILAYFARLAPAVDVLHIQNEGRASDWERVDAWKSGKRKGALDLIFTWNRGIAFVELKDGKGSPTPAQIDRMNMYHRMGWPVGLFRSVEALVPWMIDRGCPVRAFTTGARHG